MKVMKQKARKPSYSIHMTTQALADLVDQLRDLDGQIQAMAPTAQAEAVAAVEAELEWFGHAARRVAVASEIPADLHGFQHEALARLADAVNSIEAWLSLDADAFRAVVANIATQLAAAWLGGFAEGLQISAETATTGNTNS